MDLLDRLVIIRTLPYTPQEMVQILAIRAQVRPLTTTPDPITFLSVPSFCCHTSAHHHQLHLLLSFPLTGDVATQVLTIIALQWLSFFSSPFLL